MLPNRMVLSRQTEEQLKRLKGYTGITPNVAARLAFFRSVESEFRYSSNRIIGNWMVRWCWIRLRGWGDITDHGTGIEDALSAISSKGYG